MSNKVIWIVGEPGSGKSTLVRGLLGDLRNYRLNPKPKWTIGPKICAAGHYTGQAFDGADQVPYNGAQAALELWLTLLADKPLTVFDGDRFSNEKAVRFVKDSVPTAERLCVLLKGDGPAVAERRAERARANKTAPQNPTWVLGRKTKALNFYQRKELWTRTKSISCTQAPTLVFAELKSFLNQ